jgi:FMN phosphatase YigB (HAD superfamily)
MSSGHGVSEYELDASGLPPMFHHNDSGKTNEIKTNHYNTCLLVMTFFDCVIESRVENHHQRDKLFYLSVCHRAGVLPEETIYVGKRRDYLDAAASVGITTVSNITPFHTVKAISSLVNISIPLINT